MSSRAEELRALASALEDFGVCICDVGPPDLAKDEPCPNHRRAAELRREADEIDADE